MPQELGPGQRTRQEDAWASAARFEPCPCGLIEFRPSLVGPVGHVGRELPESLRRECTNHLTEIRRQIPMEPCRERGRRVRLGIPP